MSSLPPDLAHLPHPVAFPLAYAMNGDQSAADRIDNALFAAYQAMRTVALVLLCEYLASDRTDPTLVSKIQALRTPHWSDWTHLANGLVKSHDGSPGGPWTAFGPLIEGWRRYAIVDHHPGQTSADPRWVEAIAGFYNTQGKPATNGNDALWALRNDRAHRMGTRIPDEAADGEKLTRVLGIVRRLCADVFPVNALRLVRQVTADPLRVVRLEGFCPSNEAESAPEAWAPWLLPTGIAAIAGESGCSLYPLFLYDESLGAGPVEPVVLVDGIREKTATWLGVRSFAESELHVDSLREALARKEVILGLKAHQTHRWSLVDWSRMVARETLRALHSHVWFPDAYVERRGVDKAAWTTLHGGTQALLILGEAGSGKTSLLARWAAELAGESSETRTSARDSDLKTYLRARGAGDVVLYLTGRNAWRVGSTEGGFNASKSLVEAILRPAGIVSGAFDSLHQFCQKLHESVANDDQRDRKVWLLLDSPDQANWFPDLIGALDEFLSVMGQFPWLRLVIACRTAAYEALRNRKFTHEHRLARFPDPASGRWKPYLVLRRFGLDGENGGEAGEAWRRLAASSPSGRSPPSWESISPAVQRLLTVPLYLRLWHETFSEQPGEIDETALLRAYLGRLCQSAPALDDWIRECGQRMRRHRTAVLTEELRHEWLESWRSRESFQPMHRATRVDPIEELLHAGLVLGSPNDPTTLAFTHQPMAEWVLTYTLGDPAALPARAELEAAVREADGFPELRGALAIRVREVMRCNGKVFPLVIRLAPGPTRDALLAVAVEVVAGDPNVRSCELLSVAYQESHVLALLTATDASSRTAAIEGNAALGISIEEIRLQLTEKVIAPSPKVHAWQCIIRSALGALLVETGRLERGIDLLLAADADFERAELRDEATVLLQVNGQVELSVALRRPGDVHGRRTRAEAAEPLLERALASLDTLAGAPSRRRDEARARVLIELANLRSLRGAHGEARARVEEAWRLQAACEDPLVFADLHQRLAEVSFKQGDWNDAHAMASAAVDHSCQALAAAPGRADIEESASKSYFYRGWMSMKRHDLAAAEVDGRQSLVIMERLMAREPDREGWVKGILAPLMLLGEVAAGNGEREVARGFYERMIALTESYVGRADMQDDLKRARKALKKLDRP